MHLSIPVDTTSKIICFPVFDSSSNVGATLAGLVYNTAGLTAYVNRTGQTANATVNILTAGTKGVWSSSSTTSGGFVAVDAVNMPGWYEMSLPNGILAAGCQQLQIMLKGAANMVPVLLEIELIVMNTQAPAVDANIVRINNDSTYGNLATLYLKALHISNSDIGGYGVHIAGHTGGMRVVGIGPDALGVKIQSDGSGDAISIEPGLTGNGVNITGGANGGSAVIMRTGASSGSPAFKITTSGGGDGIQVISTGNGNAVYLGASGTGAGFIINNAGTSGVGIKVLGGNGVAAVDITAGSGAGAYGLRVRGGGTMAAGIYVLGSNAPGVESIGGENQPGMKLSGGAAVPANVGGPGLLVTGTGNTSGAAFYGYGTGNGMAIVGGSTSNAHGLKLTGYGAGLDLALTTAGNQNLITPATIDTLLGANHGAGSWQTGGGLTAQQARDAMKLAPTAGAPDTGSIDKHVDDIQAKTDNLPASPAATGAAMTLTAAYDSAKAASSQASVDAVKAVVDTTAAGVVVVDGIVDTLLVNVATVNGQITTVDTVVDAIKAKTDNLPASPAATGAAMTLTAAYDSAKAASSQASVDAVKAKTDNLPSDPADQSAVEAAIISAVAPLATTAGLGVVSGQITTVDSVVDTILTNLAGVGVDVNAIISRIGTPVALDGGIQTLVGMLVKMADDNGGASFDAGVDSLNAIAHTTFGVKLTDVIDGVELSAILQLIMSMANGRFKRDFPNIGDITFYKRDNATVLTIVNNTDSERIRIS